MEEVYHQKRILKQKDKLIIGDDSIPPDEIIKAQSHEPPSTTVFETIFIPPDSTIEPPAKARPRLNKRQLFQEMLTISTRLSSIFNGSVKSETQFSVCKGELSMRFTCQNEHNFFLTVEQLRLLDLDAIGRQYKSFRSQVHRIQQEQDPYGTLMTMPKDCWCNRCTEFYDYCEESINHSSIELVGGLFTKQLVFRCLSKRHVFCVSSLRKCKYQTQYRVQDYSCPDCKRETKEQQRLQQLQEEQRIAEEMAEKQKKLLEESRIRMERQQQVQDNIPLQTSMQEQEKVINEQAKRLTREFLAQQS